MKVTKSYAQTSTNKKYIQTQPKANKYNTDLHQWYKAEEKIMSKSLSDNQRLNIITISLIIVKVILLLLRPSGISFLVKNKKIYS